MLGVNRSTAQNRAFCEPPSNSGPLATAGRSAQSRPKILSAFKAVVANPGRCTVRVESDGKEVALGTVVGPDGWILTKASELKEHPVCRLRDGQRLDARVVGIHERYDLALLKIDAGALPSVDWRSSR